MIYKKCICQLLILGIIAFAIPQASEAQSPRDTLNQWVAELQRNPDNNNLREKIIVIAQRVKPAPAVPEEAHKNYIQGIAFRDDAKTKEEYTSAIEKFRSALSAAPWWGDAYKELGLTLELSEQYDEATKNLKLYLLTQPVENDARKAQDEIYIIETKKDKLAKEIERKKAEENEKAKKDAETQKLREKAENLAGKWVNEDEERLGHSDGGIQIFKSGDRYSATIPGDGKWKKDKFGNTGESFEYRLTLKDFWVSGTTIHFVEEKYIKGYPTWVYTYVLKLSSDGSELEGTINSKIPIKLYRRD